ncbi:MAG: hypothetical protein M9908_09490 [Phyllobacteriaceae bacterium]|nr:hypothetical protein [Phyllobacteriaceae bacterium]
MAKARSPRYPAIGLPEAIDKARMVYEGDHLNSIPKSVVAEHMGYNTLNGKSLGVVSALLKYGLLAGSSEAMHITDRALAILVNEKGAKERVEAIQAAAFAPELFSEIRAEYPEGVSDQALRSFLLSRKRFLQSAVDNAIRAYRETVGLVEVECVGYDSPAAKDSSEQEPDAMHEQPTETTHQKPTHQIGAPLPSKTHDGGEKPIIFDMETVSGTYSFDNADDLQEFIGKLEKIKGLMPTKQ